MNPFKLISLLILFSILLSCSDEEDDPETLTSPTITINPPVALAEIDTRNFAMGFSTWPYAATTGAQDSTYDYLDVNGDIYSEHIDDKIPWSAWINNTALPAEFVNDIQNRKNRKIAGNQLFVSVSILNNARTDLAEDVNGQTPTYDSLNQQSIEDAYVDHLNYIITELQPQKMLLALEVNELLINSPALWEPFKKLMSNVRSRIKAAHPNLPLSESVTLHNWYKAEVTDSANFVAEIRNYINNNLDFAAISFYPFFKGLSDKNGYQEAFDFLHAQTSKRIAFSETTHLAEDLVVPGLSLNIPSNTTQQKEYLETLLLNAYRNQYDFIIWWCHKDFDALWQTLDPSVQDLAQLWRDTGVIDEDGNERPAGVVWRVIQKR